jgi:hypothetical protein
VGIELVGGLVAVALAIFATLETLLVHYVKKSEREKIHRWLETRAREVTEDVADALAEPLGTDAELLADVRPPGMPDPDD